MVLEENQNLLSLFAQYLSYKLFQTIIFTKGRLKPQLTPCHFRFRRSLPIQSERQSNASKSIKKAKP